MTSDGEFKPTAMKGGYGIGPLQVLTILFIGLKLAHVIDWNWAWVLSPTWIPLALAITFFVIGTTLVYLGQLRGEK